MMTPSEREPIPALTAIQHSVLNAVIALTKEKPYPPTYTEIAERIGKSKVWARRIVDQLVTEKLIDKDAGVSRGMHVNRRGKIAARRKPVSKKGTK